ncbi:hypothetical protein ALI144C_37815 [Actinosynnema sp. ALI-1.44]|uniref:AfsR/SARP family transcriptional regulator n=1 Tax=Actinosynnema sp. ALI-1.44 TaxID=1933779 RepID=UPI00097BFE65|nr:AfsR/SARP family transcriptional regulator [Actinosynnema sp. ALI-1.44]ONI76477.1 hypothetical protein ALI144C_37815 [Actinosynnema sp. ALI-1.44]
MRLGVLGPLVVTEDGVSYVPRPPKQRQLLALFVLHANESVTTDTCVRELWDDNPPRTAVQTVQTYVMQLRRQGLPQRLVTRDSGYRFHADDGELDADRFTTLVRDALAAKASGEYDLAATMLSDALALWRGPALADVSAGPVLRARLAGITESRVTALEQRVDADLRLGRHERLVGELRLLLPEYPLNENLHAQAMLALHQAGRRDEAIGVYDTLASALAEETLTPSPRIRRLRAAIHRDDRVLRDITSSGRR